jgi:hypothetical protein
MMNFKTLSSIISVGASLALFACGSSSGGAGGAGTGGTTGSGGNASTSSSSSTSSGTGGAGHMNQCVLTTDTGNANGVGHYCTPGGGECSAFPLAGLCLADVGQDEWFCTRIGCKMDSDCGDASVCHIETAGSACIPAKCEPPAADAGADGG